MTTRYKNKVTIIGAGMVGSTSAYSLVTQDIAEEIALVDINKELTEAQVLDLQHTVPFAGQTKVRVGSYKDCRDSAVAVITCGVAQKPGETRLELLDKNAKIIKEVVKNIFANNPNIVIIMVTNPVDVLTRLAIEMFPEKEKQIMGTGTMLDSARFRHLIGKKLDINPKSIHAYILGEHGDSEFPVWSSASIGNMQLGTCQRIDDESKQKIFEEVRESAYKIIAGKKSTYFAIGAGVAYLIKTILQDKKTVLPVTHLVGKEYGMERTCLSVPAVVGKMGIVGEICLELSEKEKNNLQKSAEILNSYYESLKMV